MTPILYELRASLHCEPMSPRAFLAFLAGVDAGFLVTLPPWWTPILVVGATMLGCAIGLWMRMRWP